MRRSRTRAGAPFVVLVSGLVLVLTGCGGSGSSEATDPPASPSSSSSTPRSSGTADPAADGCPYLHAEQVSQALGSPTTETAGTLNACFFDPPGGGEGPSVLLSRIDVQIDPTDYATQSKVLCHGGVTEVEAGDEAFACVMGMGPLGQVYEDRVLITVLVTGAPDDAAGVAAAAAMLPEVVVPPGA